MNKRQKAYALSIIIPVYNEENYLADCLDSIANQTVAPAEVIVVDNNSTDDTARIAENYDFVTVINEPRQHQSFAQHTGFSAAKGDVLARIDADTILPEDWVEKILDEFNENHEVLAVSGSGVAYDVVLKRLGKFIHSRYFSLANMFAGHNLMWGSNCAFRGSTWSKIKDEVHLRHDIWEDYDLAFCLARYGEIKMMKDNEVFISYRSAHKPPLQQLKYHMRSVTTFSLRRNRLTTFGFALAWSSILILGPLVLFDYYILRPAKNIALIRSLISRLGILIDV